MLSVFFQNLALPLLLIFFIVKFILVHMFNIANLYMKNLTKIFFNEV